MQNFAIMFRVVITVAVLFEFVFSSQPLYEREYCPYGNGNGVNYNNSMIFTANLQCDDEFDDWIVRIGYVSDFTGQNFREDTLDAYIVLECEEPGNNNTFKEVVFDNGDIQHGTRQRDFDPINLTNYSASNLICSLYGCLQDVYQDLDRTWIRDIYEFKNVSCQFGPGFTTSTPSVTTVAETTQPDHTTKPSKPPQVMGEITTQSIEPSENSEHDDNDDDTTNADHDLESNIMTVTESTIQEETTSTPSQSSMASSSSSKILTIVGATLFSLLLLSCTGVLLTIALVLYKRRQKLMFIRRYGYRGHHYAVTTALDPDFHPVDVRPSGTLRLAQSLHSILEPLKASTMNLKQQPSDDKQTIIFEDDKSEILQMESSEECNSSHSMVLSVGEQSNNSTSDVESTIELKNDNKKDVQEPVQVLKLSDTGHTQMSGYVHEHGPSLDDPPRNESLESSSPLNALQSATTAKHSDTSSTAKKFQMIPLKPFHFSSNHNDSRTRSDTSSCSSGLASNTTNSSGYVSNSPAESAESTFGGFLSQTVSSDYRLPTYSVATSGYVTESSGSDSPQKDVIGYLPSHFNEDAVSLHCESETTEESSVLDCIQEYKEENHSSNHQLQDDDNKAFLGHPKEHTKDSKHDTSRNGYVTTPQSEQYIENRPNAFTNGDDAITLDSKVDGYSCDGEETLIMDDLDMIHTDLDKYNFDTVSEFSLNLNPLHFQPVDCGSDYSENM